MTASGDSTANKFLIKNRLLQSPDFDTLKMLIEEKGVSVIEFSRYYPSPELTELFERLNIENKIKNKDCLLYIKNNLRFVFINSDVSKADKEILLSHELGHICDNRLEFSNSSYSNVEKENFANEFSYRLRHQHFHTKAISFFLKKKLICLGASIALLTVPFGISNMLEHTNSIQNDNIYNNVDYISSPKEQLYYITETGERYHRAHCKHIKNNKSTLNIDLAEAVSAGYTPCLDCIGE